MKSINKRLMKIKYEIKLEHYKERESKQENDLNLKTKMPNSRSVSLSIIIINTLISQNLWENHLILQERTLIELLVRFLKTKGLALFNLFTSLLLIYASLDLSRRLPSFLLKLGALKKLLLTRNFNIR